MGFFLRRLQRAGLSDLALLGFKQTGTIHYYYRLIVSPTFDPGCVDHHNHSIRHTYQHTSKHSLSDILQQLYFETFTIQITILLSNTVLSRSLLSAITSTRHSFFQLLHHGQHSLSNSLTATHYFLLLQPSFLLATFTHFTG